MCKIDGLRNVCRECGKDGHFMEEGYVPKKWWTEEEDEFFISVYPNYTNEELIKLFYQDCTAKDLWDKAYRLGIMGKSNEAIERANKQRSEKMSGENAPWYGKQRSEDTRRKISIAKKGKYVGINNKLYGIAKTDEHRKNLSIAKAKLGRWKGNKNPRHITPLIGELNGRWEGGITAENRKIRNSDEYKDWRNNVFDRDNYTCQCCGEKSGDLEAHHIENFSSNEDKRFDVNNGITMCRKCHNPVEYNSFHYIYGTRNNTKEQLEEYIARYKSGEFRDSGVTVSIVV
jgi:5-methylcytosine-specific restriction endonuclease McrA